MIRRNEIRNTIKEYVCIIIGCAMSCMGFVLFINPYNFVPGGVFGTSIVLHNLMPQIQVGTFGMCIGIPLLILSYFLLGRGIGVRTLFATLITPLMMNALSAAAYPTAEALHNLDPNQLFGGIMNLNHDLILAAILGPVIIGIGEGLIMHGRATSGGTDIVAMIVHKYFHVRFSKALMATDACVILFGMVVIGLGLGKSEGTGHTLMLLGYSLICIFLMSRTLAYVASGSKNNKLLFIVSKKDNEELRDFVLHKLDRTGTVLEGSGLYSQQDKCTLMMVVRMREVDAVTRAIKGIDPDVFVIVTDAYDAYGTRWKPFPDKHTIEIR